MRTEPGALIDVDALLRADRWHPSSDAKSRGLWVSRNAGEAVARPDDDEEVETKVGSDAGAATMWIYGEIGGWFGVQVDDVKRALDQIGEVPEILVRVHSRGGSVFEGAAIYTLFEQHPARIHFQVDGVALSAASFMLMSGDRISMSKMSWLMMHEAWGIAIGGAEDFDAAAALLRKLNPSIADAYDVRLKVGRPQVLTLLAEETWYTAEEAVAAGLADEVLGKRTLAADAKALDLSGPDIQKAPAEAKAAFAAPIAEDEEPEEPKAEVPETETPEKAPFEALVVEIGAYLEEHPFTAHREDPDGLTPETLAAVERAICGR